jgi:hypothetical protein
MNDRLIHAVLLAHLAATLFMTGVIWFVQVIHYPLFLSVGSAEFADYEQRHTALTTWIVAPPMLVEGATALVLLWLKPHAVPTWQLTAGLGLLAVIWVSTALVQVPCHEVLSTGFEPSVVHRLVLSNWIRTVAWSLRAISTLWMVWSTLDTTRAGANL